MQNFVAIDFETANFKPSSVCSQKTPLRRRPLLPFHRENDYCIECSTDGVHFNQMRICHMHAGAEEICFGIYACSPEDSSFTALFSDMKITVCAWQAHDGQQPD